MILSEKSATFRDNALILACRMQTLKRRARVGIGFLAFHAPIFQFLEWNRSSGDRATHECAGTHDPKISVKILDLRFAGRRRMGVKAIEHRSAPDSCGMGPPLRR